jgi:hypothetical protein
MQQRIMFERPRPALDAYRPRAPRLLAALIAAMLLGLSVLSCAQTTTPRLHCGVYRGWLPWAMLAPRCYPLAVGLLCRCRVACNGVSDYRIVALRRLSAVELYRYRARS